MEQVLPQLSLFCILVNAVQARHIKVASFKMSRTLAGNTQHLRMAVTRGGRGSFSMCHSGAGYRWVT